MLPINLWGKNWRLKLREMSGESGMMEYPGDMSGDNAFSSQVGSHGEMSEEDNTSSQKVTESLDHNVARAEPKSVARVMPKLRHKKKLAMTDKYMTRLRLFANNPLARTLRAPEVWEEAVSIWTNQFDKQRFCVVMVSLQLTTYCSMC